MEMTINVVGKLSDVMLGDKLYYAHHDSLVLEVTVGYIELTKYEDGYHPTWINCKWIDPEDGTEMEDDISVCILFKSREEALKHLIQQEKEYIDSINDCKAKAQVRIMDLEEQITQLHVGDQNER